MVRNFRFLILLLVGSSLPAISDDKSDLAALLDDFLTNPTMSDYDNHNRFWAEDLIYTSSSGTRFNKRFIMDGLKQETPKADKKDTGPKYHAEEVDIRLYDNMAIVAFKLVATPDATKTQPQIYYFNTGTFLKRKGVWQAIAWQATKVPVK